jgi:hypothetical protein
MNILKCIKYYNCNIIYKIKNVIFLNKSKVKYKVTYKSIIYNIKLYKSKVIYKLNNNIEIQMYFY